ncbi:hypothetical protein ACFOKJ_03325 [Vogesella amnigena]|uniref:Uncharacterized protein n=1 Tax=Vogesella amnigena TaxID=1507449 RepID=A0ABV7TP54_9NEIS
MEATSTTTKKQIKKNTPMYLAMHENNIAMCLASGFISPRLEQNAARDHHLTSGGLVIEAIKPTHAALVGAQGDLPYGMVVLVEIKNIEDHTLAIPVIPIKQVKRFAFQSQKALTEFSARISAYNDIPGGLVPFEVAPELFESDELYQAAPEEENQGKKIIDVPESKDGSTSRDPFQSIAVIEACAGAFAAGISTLASSQGSSLFNRLHGYGGENIQIDSPVEFSVSLATHLGLSTENDVYQPLIAALVPILASTNASDGFSATSLLRKLEAIFGSPSDTESATALQKFVKFSQDIIALRRDLPDDAFSDQEGFAVPRGALLFLLNPEPETLAAVKLRIPNLGERVYFVAAFLVGMRAGVARLPKTMKASREAFLAIPDFILSIIQKKSRPLQTISRWDKNGTQQVEVTWNGSTLVGATLPAKVSLQVLADIARSLGINMSFSAVNGALVSPLNKDHMTATLSLEEGATPTFPRVPACVATLKIDCKVQKRIALKALESINKEMLNSGIFCQLTDEVKNRKLELKTYLLEPYSSEQLKLAIETLWKHTSHLSINNNPNPTK